MKQPANPERACFLVWAPPRPEGASKYSWRCRANARNTTSGLPSASTAAAKWTCRRLIVFALKDLVDLALKPDKEVILMARQCGLCARAHAAALSALLSNPSLKVFSRLVLDRATATELLK